MRIQHKYLRNRLVKFKARKRAIKIEGGLYSYKCYSPWYYYGFRGENPEEQIKSRKKYIDDWWVRCFTKGHRRGYHNAPKWYRKQIERPERHAVKQALKEMLKDINDIDNYDVPVYNHDANWTWF